MVFIFGGVNVPVLEVLLVVTVLMLMGWVMFTIGIFYILKELKEFKILLGEEERDIDKLDRDVNKLS